MHKSQKSKYAHGINNLRRQIGQFSIWSEPYVQVLNDYFQICPSAKLLEINRVEISCRMGTSNRNSVPMWTCSNYKNCKHNQQCRPSYASQHEERKAGIYGTLEDKEYLIFIDTANNKYIPEINYADYLIESPPEKVLISPDRLKQARESCHYSLEQVKNMVGLTRAALDLYEKAEEVKPKSRRKITCVAVDYHLKTIDQALCYYLAALYQTTPGYLMGYTDNMKEDFFIRKVSYYEMDKLPRSNEELARSPIHEEFEIQGSLVPCLCFYSSEKQQGLIAAKRLRKAIEGDPLRPNYEEFIQACEKLYFYPIRQDMRNDLERMLQGLLDDAGTDKNLFDQ